MLFNSLCLRFWQVLNKFINGEIKMKIIILILAVLGINSCFASTDVAQAAAAAAVEVEALDIPKVYRGSLPPMVLPKDVDLTAKVKAEAVLDYLKLMGGGDALKGDGRTSYLSSLEASITKREPIQMVILGFPFKSGNLTKVLGPEFDMGDYLGLLRLEHIASAIEDAISVKCDMHIINQEPYLYEVFEIAEMGLGVQLIDPREYQAAFVHLIKTCPHLRIGHDLNRLYGEAMEKAKATHTDEVRKEILDRTQLKPLFLGELESSASREKVCAKLVANKITSKSQQEKYLKKVRDQMVLAYELGVNVFRDVVKIVYDNMLRLSVHGDETKVMMNFAHTPGIEPDGRTCVPWHGTLLCTVAESGKVSFDLTQASKINGALKVSETVSGIDLAYMLVKE